MCVNCADRYKEQVVGSWSTHLGKGNWRVGLLQLCSSRLVFGGQLLAVSAPDGERRGGEGREGREGRSQTIKNTFENLNLSNKLQLKSY